MSTDGASTLHLPWKPLNMSVKTRTYVSFLFLLIVLGEASWQIPQIIKIYETQSADDIDPTAFIILLVMNFFWILYAALIISDLPIFVSGVSYVALSAVTLMGYYKYRSS